MAWNHSILVLRWGWDSNSRCPFRHSSFQDYRLKPLGHPTAMYGIGNKTIVPLKHHKTKQVRHKARLILFVDLRGSKRRPSTNSGLLRNPRFLNASIEAISDTGDYQCVLPTPLRGSIPPHHETNILTIKMSIFICGPTGNRTPTSSMPWRCNTVLL